MTFEDIKRMANNKSSWRDRLNAVDGLKEYDTESAKDIIVQLSLKDPVFKVKEAAFRLAQSRGYKKNGKPIFLSKKPKGNLVKDINKKLTIVNNELTEDRKFEDFKEVFKIKYPVEYDIYEGDKGERFDRWLENMFNNLPKN